MAAAIKYVFIEWNENISRENRSMKDVMFIYRKKYFFYDIDDEIFFLFPLRESINDKHCIEI
jgi:hypothetical protein